ncbi:MAG: hypothetical protein Tsb0013_22790 [Phycisphaerales bacterium]
MLKSMTAVGVLAFAGSALAAPFSIAGAQVGASGALADPGAAFGGAVPASAFNTSGVFWESSNVLAENATGSNLLGAHSGGYPAAGLPDSQGVGALVIAPDPFTGAGDTSWNVAYTIPSPANHVASSPGAFGENDVWIARISGTDLSVNFLQVIFSSDPSANLDFVLDGPGVEVAGDILFAKSFQTDGGFDIIITDAPAPGAAALLGFAGIAGLRRRRA